MPHPRRSSQEETLLGALRQFPDDDLLRLALADAADEIGSKGRADLLRRDSSMALLELLRGESLTNEQCAAIVQTGENISHQISQALWTPERPPIPDLRTAEGARKQYESQRLILASGGLPVHDCFEDVQKHLVQKHVREDLEQGPRLLLLVSRRPFADYARALEEWLRQNMHLLELEGTPLPTKPVIIANTYRRGLEYNCANSDKTFVWKNEAAWMAEKQTDILVIEPSADVPQTQRERSAEHAWNNRSPGEVFLTPQAWTMFFRTLLERGQLLDTRTWSILAGTRFAPSDDAADFSYRLVPCAWWDTEHCQAWFDCSREDGEHVRSGARGSW